MTKVKIIYTELLDDNGWVEETKLETLFLIIQKRFVDDNGYLRLPSINPKYRFNMVPKF